MFYNIKIQIKVLYNVSAKNILQYSMHRLRDL